MNGGRPDTTAGAGNSPACHGVELDAQTRCAHWHSPLDIVAIKFRCCGRFFACHACHAEMETHPPEVWAASEFAEHAVLCGACRCTMSIAEYLACGSRCPQCDAPFNPRCALHRDLYFGR